MNDRQLETVKQVGEFLASTEIVEFSIESTEGRYALIHATLRKFRDGQLGKAEKRLIGHYLRKMTGYFRQQLTRRDYRKTQGLGRPTSPRPAPEGASGPATDLTSIGILLANEIV
ncbi:MAG: hypothetical protein ACREX3_17325 [Gammaproteobacteria bacterium]